MKAEIKVAFALTISLYASKAFGGTTQIYSPSGLSPNSFQNAAPPVAPSNLSAPTTSIPQEFAPAGSPLPNASHDASPTRAQDDILNGSWPGQPQNNSVESFFQLKPQTSNNSAQLSPSEAALKSETAHAQKDNSALGGAARFLWHTLDNVGIPMFVGKDSDLDPSLRDNFVPPPGLNTDHALTKGSENHTASSSANLERIIPIDCKSPPQKFPQSELEGIEVSPKNDSRIPTP